MIRTLGQPRPGDSAQLTSAIEAVKAEIDSRAPNVKLSGSAYAFNEGDYSAKIEAIAHKQSGIPPSVGGRLSPSSEAELSEARENVIREIAGKMLGGKSYDSAFAEVYEDAGSPLPLFPSMGSAEEPPAPKEDEMSKDGSWGGYEPKIPGEYTAPLTPSTACPPCFTAQPSVYGGPDDCVFTGGPGCEPFDPKNNLNKDIDLAQDILNAFQKALDASAFGLRTASQIELQNEVRAGSQEMRAGQNEMLSASNDINDSTYGISQANADMFSYADDLASLQSTLSSQLSSINSLTSSLQSQQTQLSGAQDTYAQAQARLNLALNRANYPMTTAGLNQQRADLRTANTDIFNSRTQINSLNLSIANTSGQLNTVGTSYNQNLATATGYETNIAQSYEQAQAFERARSAGVAKYNLGASRTQAGLERIRNAVQDNQNDLNIALKLESSKIGLRGASEVLEAIQQGKGYTAVGKGLNAGLEIVAKNSGDPGVKLATGLTGAFLDYATGALDATVGKNGWNETSIQNAGREFAMRAGNSMVGLNSMMQAVDGMGLADTVFNNQNNPNRVADGFRVLSQQIGPIGDALTKTTQTGLSLMPGMQGFVPLAGQVGLGGSTLAQGLASNTVEVFDKLSRGEFSAPVGNYPPRSIGRGLLDRTSGGSVSAVGQFMIGNTAVALTAGEATFSSAWAGKQDYPAKATGLAQSIAETANIPRLRPGSVSIGPRPIAGD